MVVTIFMKGFAAAALNARIAKWSKSHKCKKEGTVTSYCPAGHDLLETYGMDDSIAETDADMVCFTLPLIKYHIEYVEALLK